MKIKLESSGPINLSTSAVKLLMGEATETSSKWDLLKIAINDNGTIYFINLKERTNALDIIRFISKAIEDGHKGRLVVPINGNEYDLSDHAYMNLFFQLFDWWESYMEYLTSPELNETIDWDNVPELFVDVFPDDDGV